MKRIKMLLTVIAVTTLLSGCSFGTIEEQKTGDVTYEIVKKEEIPEQLKEEIKEAGKKGNVDQLCRYRKGRSIPVCSAGIRDTADDRLQH